jgi:Flp pilus assembly protein TadD
VAAYVSGVEERLQQERLRREREQVQRAEERRRRKLWLGLAAAGALLVAVVGGGAWWAQQQHVRRQQDVDVRVGLALGEARLLFEQATAAPLGDAGRYRQALAAAQKAKELARPGEASEVMRREAAELLELITDEAAAADRDRRLLLDLMEVRGPREGPNYQKDERGLLVALAEPSAEEQFAAAFRAWDPSFDVDVLPAEEAAARLKQRPGLVVTEVIAALDEWAGERRRQGKAAPPLQHVADLAAALDEAGSRRAELRALLAGGSLERERALGALSMALRPVPVPFDVGPGEARARLRQLAAATDAAGEPVLGLLALARALRAAGEDARAEGLLRAALRARPREVVLYHSLGKLLQGQRPPRWRDAAKCYAATRALRPELGEVLAHALVNSGDLDVAEGLALYDRLVVERKDNPWLHFKRGNALHGRGRWHEAETAYREALRLYPNFPEAHSNLGDALLEQGHAKDAEAECLEARRLNPDFFGAHYNLGNALLDQDRYADAEAAYREAVRLNPDYAEAHHNRGIALKRQGRYPEAEAAYRNALRLKPDFPEVHRNLGLAYREQGRYQDAADAFREAIKLKPHYVKAYNSLGDVLEKLDQPAKAEAAFRQAITIQPEDPEAHCNLGGLLLRQGKFADALAPLRRGHERGTRTPGWRYPSDQWVRDCERLVEVDGRLPAVLRGDAEPATPAECLELASLCQMPCKRLHVAAARFAAAAFASDPGLADDLRRQHRYNAARSAALAAAGQAEDAGNLPDKAAVMLRRQALAWLRADLALHTKRAEAGDPKAKLAVQQALRRWQKDADLASIRDAAVLAGLSDGEDWRQFWDEVRRMLRQTNG